MFSSVFGLPTHALIIHFTVVAVPTVALAALVVALWPVARRRAALWVLAVATPVLIAIPITTASGEELQGMVPNNEQIEKHADLGDTLLPVFAVLWLGLAAIVGIAWYAKRGGDDAAPRWAAPLTLAAAALTVLAAVGSGVQTVRIGHSGAEAIWGDVVENADKYQKD